MLVHLNFIMTEVSLYQKQGDNWDKTCKIGKFQSPVNIVKGLNTKINKSKTEFLYTLPEGAPRFRYDGTTLVLEANLGKMIHYNELKDKIIKEEYEAYKIEIHLPSEHYITQNGQTPRAAAEIQIFHKLIKTEESEFTNRILQVSTSIVSILLDVVGNQPDIFLDSMGISGKNFYYKKLIQMKQVD